MLIASDLEVVCRPWWIKSTANWVEFPSPGKLRELSDEVKKVSYSERYGRVSELKLPIWVQLVVMIHATGQYRFEVEKYFKLTKLASNEKAFYEKFTTEEVSKLKNLDAILELFESKDFIDKCRSILQPRRVRVMTDAKIKEYQSIRF